VHVQKYKKMRDGKYRVLFSSGKELDLYEDVILKYELLFNRDIPADKVLEIMDYNQECDTYYVALKYLKTRFRSSREVFDMLKRKEYPVDLIQKALDKLEQQGYINDYNYAYSFLHDQLITTSRGPNKISYELEKKGIRRDLISEVMSGYTDEIEIEKITKIVHRMIKSNRSKGNLLLKKKIEQDLLRQGFHKENIYSVIADSSFSDEEDLYQREYEKVKRRLEKKYSGDVLNYKIKQQLYQKGFR